MNQTVVLYQVDVTKTNADALYGEGDAKQISYKTLQLKFIVYMK